MGPFVKLTVPGPFSGGSKAGQDQAILVNLGQVCDARREGDVTILTYAAMCSVSQQVQAEIPFVTATRSQGLVFERIVKETPDQIYEAISQDT
jgi:N-glycosylase/DNA lyase